MFGLSEGLSAVLDDAFYGADVTRLQVERGFESWRAPSGELVETVYVYVWAESLADVRRLLPRLGLPMVERSPAFPAWRGWLTTDAAARLRFPVVLDVSAFGVGPCDQGLIVTDDATIIPATTPAPAPAAAGSEG